VAKSGYVQLAANGKFRVQLTSKKLDFSGEFQGVKPVKPTASTGFMERAMGIEPTSEAWEARNKNLKTLELAALSKL